MSTNEQNSKNLERFVRDNREAFDHLEPAPMLWDKVGATVGEQPQLKNSRVVRMSWVRWAVAATLFLALAGTLGYMLYRNSAEEVRSSQVAQTMWICWLARSIRSMRNWFPSLQKLLKPSKQSCVKSKKMIPHFISNFQETSINWIPPITCCAAP